MLRRIGLVAGSLLLAGTVYNKLSSSKKQKHITVFVHGYLGTYDSFGPLLTRFERNNWGQKSAICYVSEDDQLEIAQLKNDVKDHEFIQVIFFNHRGSFEDYARWLSLVMKALQNKYPNAIFNLVGHSMGGITSIKYLQDYSNKDGFPNVNKVVTLGSPFSGIEDQAYFEEHGFNSATIDLQANSAALQKLRINRYKVPENIGILNIGSIGDEVVTPKSVLALDEIVQSNHIKHYIINRSKVTHSGIHEDEEVDQLIYSYLLR